MTIAEQLPPALLRAHVTVETQVPDNDCTIGFCCSSGRCLHTRTLYDCEVTVSEAGTLDGFDFFFGHPLG